MRWRSRSWAIRAWAGRATPSSRRSWRPSAAGCSARPSRSSAAPRRCSRTSFPSASWACLTLRNPSDLNPTRFDEEIEMAVLTEEQSMLRDAAKSWVQEKSPVTAFRRMRDSGAELGYDTAAWNEMAEMGWAGVIIPEEYGGSDFGYLSLGLILEETGRTLTASPLLASALGAASALILGGSDAQKSAWLPKIAEGSAVATLAVDAGPHHARDKGPATVSGGKLNGRKVFVLEGMAANV